MRQLKISDQQTLCMDDSCRAFFHLFGIAMVVVLLCLKTVC